MAQSRQRPPAELTPPGIAILSLLWRQPMHPYEMRHLIRVQEIDRVMKVTHGTLYSTVDRLAASGLIQQVETSRDDDHLGLAHLFFTSPRWCLRTITVWPSTTRSLVTPPPASCKGPLGAIRNVSSVVAGRENLTGVPT